MKRFVWRLQRVLDIRTRQEQKARSELLELTETLAATRGEMLIQKKILEDIVKGLSSHSPKQRLSEQEFFLAYSSVSNEKIKKLKEKISKLETQQRQKIAEVLKIRKSKEGMEKLRAQAKVQYIKEQEKLEQKELDEGANVLFIHSLHN